MNDMKACVAERRRSIPQNVDETNSLLGECINIAGDILLLLMKKEKIGIPGVVPECFLEAVDFTQASVKLLHDELTEIASAFGCE